MGRDVRGSCRACRERKRYHTLYLSCLAVLKSSSIGTGFHTRNRNEQDVDDEVDVDGDDQFGDAQFTEGDILPVDTPQPAVEEEVEVDIEDDDEDETQRAQKTLRALVAEGKVVRRTSDDGIACVKAKVEEVMVVADAEKMDFAILGAQKRGDKSFLIKALENKVKQLVSTCQNLAHQV